MFESDGECIAAVKCAVEASSNFEMGVDVSPVGDSQANVDGERVARTVQDQGRTRKSAHGAHCNAVW
eukprot:1114924-Pyramimonas_sp.AAC.1